MSDETAAVKPNRLMVCIGNRINDAGKKVVAWKDLDADQNIVGNEAAYTWWGDGNPLKGVKANAGGIFEFQAGGTGYYTTGKNAPKFLGMFADQASIQRWQLAHKAANVEIDAKKRAAKLQAEDHLIDGLAPFRDAYRSASAAQRRALLVLAIEYITK